MKKGRLHMGFEDIVLVVSSILLVIGVVILFLLL